jgi:ABC-type polysaccharide/polyol phosphate export permease
MFQVQEEQSQLSQVIGLFEVIYHATVRAIRKRHSNALFGLLLNMLQTMMLVAVFYLMFAVLGMRRAALRGDFLIYIMSGIFLYMTHIKTVSAVAMAEGPNSSIMHHAPMTTFVTISAAALSQLYLQLLSVMVVLYIYHIAISPIEFYDISGTFFMLLLSWFTGIGVGLIFLALKPWLPQFSAVAQQLYTRANMIASGKMFVANTLPHKMLVLFNWNPLFHTIDQARGFAFINYSPHYSNWLYPLLVGQALLLIGFMGEAYTRKHASLSWSSRQ